MRNATAECMLKKDKKEILELLMLVCGFFSLLCCLFILIVVAIFKKYRTTIQRITVYLTLSVASTSVLYILHSFEYYLGDNYSYCEVVGYLDNTLTWMVTLSILCISVDLFTKVMTNNFNASRIRFDIAYVLVIFVFPLTFNWIPFIGGHYNNKTGSYCWINPFKDNSCSIDPVGIGYQFGLYWVPLVMIVVSIIVMYILALCKVRARRRAYMAIFDPSEQLNREILFSEVNRYMLYPAVFILMNCVTLADRITDVAVPRTTVFALQIVHVLFISLQGLPIAIIFILIDPDNRRDLCNRQKCGGSLFAFFCCRRLEEAHEYRQIVPNALSDSLS